MLLSEKIPVLRTREDAGVADFAPRCSPRDVYRMAGVLSPWFGAIALALCAAGLYLGFVAAPADPARGEIQRVAYLHVPAFWMSVLVYLLVALLTGVGLGRNSEVAAMLAQALAPTGMMFAILALWTGCLWARPTCGIWCNWDLRLVSELILLAAYAGIAAMRAAIEDARRSDKACAILALVGAVGVIASNIASLQTWTVPDSGVQPGSCGIPGLGGVSLAGVAVMDFALLAYCACVALLRLRCIILERERDSDWVSPRASTLS